MNEDTEKLLNGQCITKIRGKYYEADKIDVLLDSMTEYIAKSNDTIKQLKDSESELENASYRASLILKEAQEKADKIQKEAEAKADEILEDAVLRAARINETKPVVHTVKVRKNNSGSANPTDTRGEKSRKQIEMIRQSSKKILDQQAAAHQNIRSELNGLLSALETESSTDFDYSDMQNKISRIADDIRLINDD